MLQSAWREKCGARHLDESRGATPRFGVCTPTWTKGVSTAEFPDVVHAAKQESDHGFHSSSGHLTPRIGPPRSWRT
jgi:hypothetical protein